MKWRRWLLIIIFLMFICIEMCPFSIAYSSVFTTSGQTEIHLYVQMNTFLSVNKDEMIEKIVTEHQNINQLEGEVSYSIHLYRTAVHYNLDCEYDTIMCDKNGAIICCETDLGV